jgi:hypothetical protein
MGHPAPGLFGGGRFGPEAGVEAFDDTVDDEGEAGGELGRVGDLFGGDGVGQVEAGTDDGEGGVFFLRAGLGAVKGFDALEERGKKRKGAEGFSLPRASISFSVFSKAYFPLASLRIFQRSEGLAQVSGCQEVGALLAGDSLGPLASARHLFAAVRFAFRYPRKVHCILSTSIRRHPGFKMGRTGERRQFYSFGQTNLSNDDLIYSLVQLMKYNLWVIYAIVGCWK